MDDLETWLAIIDDDQLTVADIKAGERLLMLGPDVYVIPLRGDDLPEPTNFDPITVTAERGSHTPFCVERLFLRRVNG